MQKTRCWRYIKVLSRSPYPTKAWLPRVTLSSVKCAFFMLFHYAVSISRKTTYISRWKTILYKKEMHQPFLKINIHYLQGEFL